MMRYILYIIGGLFLCACNNNFSGKEDLSTYLQFIKKDSIEISLPYEAYPTALNMQVYYEGDSAMLLIGNIDMDVIFEVNLDREKNHLIRKVDFIRPEASFYRHFYAFRVDSGSIFIRDAAGNYWDHNNDSTLMLLDNLGRIKKRFGISHGPLKLPVGHPKSLRVIPFHSSISFAEGRLFMSMRGGRGDETEKSRAGQLAEVSYFDVNPDPLNQDKLAYKEVSFTRPDPYDHYYDWDQQQIFNLAISKNKLLIAYANRQEFYLHDLSDSLTLSSSSPNIWLNKAIPLESKEQVDQINYKSVLYNQVVYDSISNGYLRFARPELKDSLDVEKYRLIFREWAGLYDKDLGLAAQGVLPKWLLSSFPSPIFHNGRLISLGSYWDKGSTFKLYIADIDTIKVNSVELDSLKSSLFDVEKMRRESLESLLLELGMPDDSYILIVPSLACPGCVNAALEYYFKQYESDELKSLFLITDGDHLNNLPKNLNKYNRVKYVEEGDLSVYGLESSNPTLLFWNGERVPARILLDPDKVGDIDEQLGYLVSIIDSM